MATNKKLDKGVLAALGAARTKDAWCDIPAAGFRREDWKQEVADNNTQLGYWEWLGHRVDALQEGLRARRSSKENSELSRAIQAWANSKKA